MDLGYAIRQDLLLVVNTFPHIMEQLRTEAKNIICLFVALHGHNTQRQQSKWFQQFWCKIEGKRPTGGTLQELAMAMIGVELDKGTSKGSWDERPLNEKRNITPFHLSV